MSAARKIRGKKTKKFPCPNKTGGFTIFSRQIWRFFVPNELFHRLQRSAYIKLVKFSFQR